MRARFKAIDPDKITMELTVSMTMAEWDQVREAITASGKPTHYGVLGWLMSSINDMFGQARKIYWPETQGGP